MFFNRQAFLLLKESCNEYRKIYVFKCLKALQSLPLNRQSLSHCKFTENHSCYKKEQKFVAHHKFKRQNYFGLISPFTPAQAH